MSDVDEDLLDVQIDTDSESVHREMLDPSLVHERDEQEVDDSASYIQGTRNDDDQPSRVVGQS